MVIPRIIPTLLLAGENLVKTVQFSKPAYIGDPINTIRIFNELEVDELIFLDIEASPKKRKPNWGLLHKIADECFMPLGYGGGITNVEDIRTVLSIGFEKVIINTGFHHHPDLIAQAVEQFGSQSIIVSIDVRQNVFGRYEVWVNGGTLNTHAHPLPWAKSAAEKGTGEIFLTSINREGTWQGFDLDLIANISQAVSVPVIAHGGAGSIQDIGLAIRRAGASAAALGSLVVFQKKGMGVLVNFPDRTQLERSLSGES